MPPRQTDLTARLSWINWNNLGINPVFRRSFAAKLNRTNKMLLLKARGDNSALISELHSFEGQKTTNSSASYESNSIATGASIITPNSSELLDISGCLMTETTVARQHQSCQSLSLDSCPTNSQVACSRPNDIASLSSFDKNFQQNIAMIEPVQQQHEEQRAHHLLELHPASSNMIERNRNLALDFHCEQVVANPIAVTPQMSRYQTTPVADERLHPTSYIQQLKTTQQAPQSVATNQRTEYHHQQQQEHHHHSNNNNHHYGNYHQFMYGHYEHGLVTHQGTSVVCNEPTAAITMSPAASTTMATSRLNFS